MRTRGHEYVTHLTASHILVAYEHFSGQIGEAYGWEHANHLLLVRDHDVDRLLRSSEALHRHWLHDDEHHPHGCDADDNDH